MPNPQWPDTTMPSRATRRRIRLRQDFENSMLASDLDDKDASIHPWLAPPPARVVVAVPPELLSQSQLQSQSQSQREGLVHPQPLQPYPGVSLQGSRPDIWPEPAVEDAPGMWVRITRTAAIGGAVVISALVLTKGLAEMVWEFVSR